MPSMLTLQEVWPRALEVLTESLKRRSLAKWIPELQPVSYDGATLVVSVPTPFVKDWMEGKAAPLLSRKLSDAFDAPIAVQFTVAQLALSLDAPAPSAPPAKRARGKAADDGFFSSLPLNPRYTFAQFVVGKHSQIAHAAALAVSRQPGHSYNPLFIYGGVGLGKTHLMQAIGHAALRENPGLKVTYVSGDTFTYHVVTSIREDRFGAFRDAYRDVDIWLVDDIQFIASRERTETEFFQVFNTLVETGRQIVITSDRAPKDLQILDPRLSSRFEWGLMTDIKAPDLETRIAILQKKAALEGIPVPDEVIRYIATTISGNIRSLEGALIKVLAAHSLSQQELTVSLAMEQLRDHSHGPTSRLLTIADVQQMVLRHYGISLEDLTGARRTQHLVLPRQVAMYLCRQLLNASFPEIARHFGGRDHSTVIYACTKMEETMKMDQQVRIVVDELASRLQEAMSGRG
ncbi:MAG TPA: chromosomal replication initiator protein DnaA [Armatimonadota bacterium]|nr:chromosomal replication initiator protein DnaA [Armatimonadota bacterium]